MNFWILTIGWLALYTVVGYALKTRLEAQGHRLLDRLSIHGPLTLIHSQRGLATVERVSEWRVWKYWGPLGVGVSFAWMLLTIVMLGKAAISILQNPSTSTISQPKNYLVIPGVNDFLPMAAAPELVISLLVAMFIHEGGHAIFCRTGGIEIDSTGVVLLGLIPMGAFVEPDEQSQAKSSRWNQLQMISAGILNNTALTVVMIAVLMSPLLGVIAPAQGAGVSGVAPGGPAESAGIQQGDVIVAVGNTSVGSNTEFSRVLRNETGKTVSVTMSDGRTVSVNRSVFVSGATSDTSNLSVGSEITHVQGSQVSTVNEFRSAVTNASGTEVSVTLASGDTLTLPRGATVLVRPGEAFSNAGAPAGESVVVTSVNGTETPTTDALLAALKRTEPGQSVTVTTMSNGSESTYNVTLGDSGQGFGYLGVSTASGVAGVTVSDFGVGLFPAEKFLGLVRGDQLSLLEHAGVVLALPFASLVGLNHNFPGFTPTMQSYYTVQGVSPGLEGVVFFGASLVFWLAWLNLNLALFNAIPTFALDGGHLVRIAAEEGFDRVNINPNGTLARWVKLAIVVIALVVLLIPMVVPLL